MEEFRTRTGTPQQNGKNEQRGQAEIKVNIHVADVVYIGQYINGENREQAQRRNDAFGNVFAVHDGNRLVMVGKIAGDVFQIFGDFAYQKQQVQKRGMCENDPGFDFVGIVQFLFVEVNQDAEKRENGQQRGGQIPDDRVFLELVRVEPDQENIHRKEQNHTPGNKNRNQDDQKVERKIHIQFGALAHQSVEHGFVRTVNQVFLGIVKIVDDVTRSDRQARSQNEDEHIGIQQDLHRTRAFGRQNENRRQVLRQDNDRNVVAAYDREQTDDFS